MLTYKHDILAVEYNLLRETVGWGALPEEQAYAGLEHSFKVISCYDGEKNVASARILWDRGYIAYLADVMVLPDYQGQGIGKMMVTELLDELRKQMKEDWYVKVVLVAAPNKEAFYERLGFTIRPNEHLGAGMQIVL